MELNWPGTALILGAFALVVFRRPLTQLLERTEKVKDWIVAPAQPQQFSTTADESLPARDAAQEHRVLEQLTREFDNQLLVLQEASIRDDLRGHGLTAEGACERVLVRHLAGTQILLHFERIYNDIFASQLKALRWLNAQSLAVHSENLRVFYQEAVEQWPTIYRGRDFRTWLGYLALRGLLKESEESADAGESEEPYGLEITVLGREFLAFLVRDGRADPIVG